MTRLLNIRYMLPVQLLFHHVKRNLPLLLFWFIFLGAVFGSVGKVYGIHYLFLDPEYLGKVGFWSFFFVGLGFANFALAFFITSYILDSHYFSFVALLKKPFLKFSVNNSTIPVLVLVTYLVKVILFQLNNEYTTTKEILIFVIGFLAGVFMMIVLAFLYFWFTNKDIFRYFQGNLDKRMRKSKLSRDRMMKKWKESTENNYYVESYLDLRLRQKNCLHLHNFHDRQAILKVFDQNHFNSVLFEILIILTVLILGTFMDNPVFQIPAAASALLLFSIIIMLVGAITYWFKGWGVAFVAALLIIANFFVEQGITKGINRTPGMTYKSTLEYSAASLVAHNTAEKYEQDKLETIQVLENWKARNGHSEQPKLLIQCVSGGGQRAALWSVMAMQKSDSILRGNLMEHMFMITGASGGMVGAAYFRELYSQSLDNPTLQLNSPVWPQNIGKDNLNPIIFSLVVNDTFFKLRYFEYGNQLYKKNRGYMFENSLNRNLNMAFNKSLKAYSDLESSAQLPMLLLSPTIANDGRKLYISPLPVSYMNTNPDRPGKIRGVDFRQYFGSHGAENLSLLTGLRMSASFPYITPTLSLPSEPRLEIMDAGISDNFGISDALIFLQTFQDWISANTSGVVLLVIRDTPKIRDPKPRPNPGIIGRFTAPISSVYNNLAGIQDLNNDRHLQHVDDWLDAPFDMVELEYGDTEKIGRASLSWHLTSKEKESIQQAIYNENNQRALQKLGELFTDSAR
ncbi:MAG: patatin-like phospholipase family protein [Cytophagales bacterium]|nr:patatin-like phospholipase family protein [Cytophagales bacterium]